MKKLVMFILLLVNLVLQTTFLSIFNIYGVTVNLTLLLIIIFSMNTDYFTSIIMAVGIGLIADILSLDTIGMSSLAYLTIACAVNFISYEMNLENKLWYILIVSIATIAFNTIILFIIFFLGYNVFNLPYILEKVTIEIIINCIVFIFLKKVVESLFLKLNIKFIRENKDNNC